MLSPPIEKDLTMRYPFPIIAVAVICFAGQMHSKRACADEGNTAIGLIETCLTDPIELETVSVWVPAAKVGPLINIGCMPKRDCPFSFELAADVNHSKSNACPDGLARLLAQCAAQYYRESMPLTIFNGWQWEYTYSLCQFQTTTYTLNPHGGNWENSTEAILTLSAGALKLQPFLITDTGRCVSDPNGVQEKSFIEARTFSLMRTRDGYPKSRNL